MDKKHKTGLKWVGALGAIISAVTPLIVVLKNDESKIKADEKELHDDEETIAKLYAEILNQANISAESINNIRQILLEVYTKLYAIEAKNSGVELNMDVMKKKLDDLEKAVNRILRGFVYDHH